MIVDPYAGSSTVPTAQLRNARGCGIARIGKVDYLADLALRECVAFVRCAVNTVTISYLYNPHRRRRWGIHTGVHRGCASQKRLAAKHGAGSQWKSKQSILLNHLP